MDKNYVAIFFQIIKKSKFFKHCVKPKCLEYAELFTDDAYESLALEVRQYSVIGAIGHDRLRVVATINHWLTPHEENLRDPPDSSAVDQRRRRETCLITIDDESINYYLLLVPFNLFCCAAPRHHFTSRK